MTVNDRIRAITMTPAHHAVADELFAVRPWYADDEAMLRATHPNSAHRMKHCVPTLAMTQEQLARLLAECALHNTRDRFLYTYEPASAESHALFLKSRDDLTLTNALVDRARTGDASAWEACSHYLDNLHQSKMVRERGHVEKVPRGIPESVIELFRASFLGGPQRPIPRKSWREHSSPQRAAIRLAVWFACESTLKPTSRSDAASGCSVVADIMGINVSTVAGYWKERTEREGRGRSW